MTSRTETNAIRREDTCVPAGKASEGIQNPSAGGPENAGGNDTRQNARAIGQESGSEYNVSGSIEGAGMVGLVTGGTNTVTNSATPVEDKKENHKGDKESHKVTGLADLGARKASDHAGIRNPNAGDDYWARLGQGQKAKSVGHEIGSQYNISGHVAGAGMVAVVKGGINTVKSSTAVQGERLRQGQKANGGNDTASRETAGGSESCGQKAKSGGHEIGSQYNISGHVAGAGMVAVVRGGINTVKSSTAVQGEEKDGSRQEAAGGNATDRQEAVGGNATDGQKAVGHETGSVYNIGSQILGAGIVGVVSGGINTVEHSTITPVEDNKESHKGDKEAVGRNNIGGGKSVDQNV